MNSPENYDPNLEDELVEFAFCDIGQASRQILSKLGRSYREGEILFLEGETGSTLFIIISGKVEVSKKDSSGRDITLARLGSGEILGEMSHFDSLPRSASARAIEDSKLLCLSPGNFSLIFQLHPKWTKVLIEGLCERIGKSLDELLAP